jgi:hypothetical protein
MEVGALLLLTEDEAALEAAVQSSRATAELLRFAREGEYSTSFAFDTEVTASLAAALLLAVGLETPRLPALIKQFGSHGEPELVADLTNALRRFLAGWGN